jgi:hypothetical protein
MTAKKKRPAKVRRATPKEQANNHRKTERNPVTLIAAALGRLAA